MNYSSSRMSSVVYSVQASLSAMLLSEMSQFVENMAEGKYLSKLRDKLAEPEAKELQMKIKQPSPLKIRGGNNMGSIFLKCNSSYFIRKTEFLIHCLFNDPTYPPTWTPVSTYSSRPSHLEICGLQRYIGYLAGKLWNRFLYARPLNILQDYHRVLNY